MRYDLCKGLAYKTYAKDEEKKPIIVAKKEVLIAEIKKATEIAKTITLDNMCAKKEELRRTRELN